MTPPHTTTSGLLLAGLLSLALPLAGSTPAPRMTARIVQTPQANVDLCNFEGNSWGAGSAPVCDPFVECWVDRYTCSVNARTGFFDLMHVSQCGNCQPPPPTGNTAMLTPLPNVGGPESGFERVSLGPGGVEAVGGGSLSPALSDDGRYVVFDSAATNLVANDTNGFRDVFVFDRLLGQTERVSVATGGTQANHNSVAGAISADGNVVVFLSVANNLVANDTNNRGDVFVRNRVAGTTERVSVGPGGVEATGVSIFWAIPVGSWPEFGTRVLIYEGFGPDNTETAISADGRYVAFVSDATNLVAGDTNDLPDVFVHDRQTGLTSRVNLTDAGTQITHAAGTAALTRPHLAMSGDGRFVAFSSVFAAVAADTNGTSDVYVRDLQTATTTRISVSSAGVQGNGYAGWPAISGDGRFVAFASDASNLVPGADNQRDVYLHDRQTGETRRVSTNTSPGFTDRALTPAISRNGRWVAFTRPLARHVFLYDAQSGVMHLVSRLTGGPASAVPLAPALSADGAVIAFASPAPELVANDANGTDDVFVATNNLIYNGSFSGGVAYWQTFGIPSNGIVWSVTNGAMHFHRTGSQAVVLQSTFALVPSGVPLAAEFDLANTSSVRKRVSVLIHDSNFMDLSVCTFWLPPNAPSHTYRMTTHTTQAWTNATMSFYAASLGSNGGDYVLDNVSLRAAPGSSTTTTECIDPLAPAAIGGNAGPNLLINADFSAGVPPWQLFGQIVSQVSGGVFEFYRPPGTPSGVVFQSSLQSMLANDILTATFELGNSSAVRKRVTVLIHDASFSDLSACTFWLPPGQPLSPYAMRTYATANWSNATLSLYPSTVDSIQWTRLDNATLQRTPGQTIPGTLCIEPGHAPNLVMAFGSVSARANALPVLRDGEAHDVNLGHASRARSSTAEAMFVADLTEVLDPGAEMSRRLRFQSRLTSAARGLVQVSANNGAWITVAEVPGADDWTTEEVDLVDYAGAVVRIRFLLADGGDADRDWNWRLANLRLDRARGPNRPANPMSGHTRARHPTR